MGVNEATIRDCEECWTEASRAAQLWGGVAADWYPQVLAAHPDGHGIFPPDSELFQ